MYSPSTGWRQFGFQLLNENFSQKNDSIFLFIFFFRAAKLGCQQNKFWVKMFWPALPEALN